MNIIFYVAAAVALLSTVMVITRYHAVHALLYLIVSFLSVALIFYLVGAPLVAALEIIIYAGAIMVLFIFVVMMLNLGSQSEEQEKDWMTPGVWIGPVVLSCILFAEFMIVFFSARESSEGLHMVGIHQVGISMFTEYLLGVELAGMILMAAIMGAYHLGSREKRIQHRYFEDLKKKENVT
jgi:NADH-quinone oxidoreductase subunit J